MSDAAREAALPFVAWSRIWSPLTPEPWRDEAWQALELPGSWQDVETEYWSTFHVGLPAPDVPLLLHASLGRNGSSVREDWMRVISHLGLTWKEHTLPPDHLGAACDVVARAIELGEDVLLRELCQRYLLPWCEVAAQTLSERTSALGRLPAYFEAELRRL